MQETQETRVRTLGWEDSLEEGMATHFSILAWRISRTEEPGGLQFMRLQRVGQDWAPTLNLISKRSSEFGTWGGCGNLWFVRSTGGNLDLILTQEGGSSYRTEPSPCGVWCCPDRWCQNWVRLKDTQLGHGIALCVENHMWCQKWSSVAVKCWK